MVEPRRSPYCNPIKQIWDVLGCGITRMHNSPRNLGELCQALLDKCEDISVECLQCLVASIPRLLVAIIAARGGNTRHCSSRHKTTLTGSIMQKKIKFVWPDLPQYHSKKFKYAHGVKFSNINKCHHKFTKLHIKQNSGYNTYLIHCTTSIQSEVMYGKIVVCQQQCQNWFLLVMHTRGREYLHLKSLIRLLKERRLIYHRYCSSLGPSHYKDVVLPVQGFWS